MELREISYPDPQAIDISIAQRLVDDMGSENNEIEWDSAGKVVTRVTNVTRILHYTWSKTFESSVEASSLTLKGNLARLSFDEGKWALGANYLTPIFWEGVANAREETTELHIEAPATQRMTGGYKIVMDEASCIVPFKATMFITTLDDGEVPLLVEGELDLVVFGNMRFCPI